MAKLKSVSRTKLNTLIKKLPKPVQEHSKRCKKLASYLLDRMRAEEFFIDAGYNAEEIAAAVYYHDIGKIRVSKDCLYLAHCKTVDQRDIYRSHVEEGVRLCEKTLEASLIEYPENTFEAYLLQILQNHHERLDSTGFPDRKKDRDISFAARICAVVDEFDNLFLVGAAGNYNFENAVEKLLENAEKKLDTGLVNLFVKDERILRDYCDYLCDGEKNKRRKDSYGVHIKFEPVVNLDREAVICYNAKPVVNDPYYGDINMHLLVSAAEKSGQITKLQKIIFDRVCRDISVLRFRGINLSKVFLTFSVKNFEKKRFISELEKTIAKYELEPSRFGFGIAESDFYSSDIDFSALFNELHLKGFSVSVEEFGNKSSLINSFDTFTPDRLVFGKETAEKAAEYVKTADIVKGMADITKKLGILTVMEGIESDKIKSSALHMGIIYGSGGRCGEAAEAKDFPSPKRG